MVLVTLALAASACLAQEAKPLKNADIKQMVAAGLNDDTIALAIRGRRCEFDTSVDALIDLKNANVSQKIIGLMLAGPPPPSVEAAAAPAAAPKTRPAESAARAPVAEPESIGVVFYLDPESRAMKELPLEEWKAQGHSGWMTVTGSLVVRGETSSFHVSQNYPTEFVFRIGNPEAIKLYRFTQKGEKREFVAVTAKGRSRQTDPGIPVDVTKYGESSYKLKPRSPLGPGEYAIVTAEKVYSFGVDAGGGPK